jgi:AcrR family transcriptional regulator
MFVHVWYSRSREATLAQRKLEAKPRKTPKQARSRDTVDAILEATIRVLLERGYAQTTTIAIAERAGVSVGSLYQYFPSKEALVAALIDRHVSKMLEEMELQLGDHVTDPPEVVIAKLIRGSVESHRLEPELHKILIEEVPRVGKAAESLDVSRKIVKIVERFLARHRERLVVRDVRLAAFVVETVVEALSHRAIIDGPHRLSYEDVEAETEHLVKLYLFGPVPRAGRGRSRGAATRRRRAVTSK